MKDRNIYRQFSFWIAISFSLHTFALTPDSQPLPAFSIQPTILVTNIIGLSGIRQISPFHAGGAIPSNPEFLIKTLKGQMLDPERLLISSSSNYGIPIFNQQLLAGSILSLDIGNGSLSIPADFAKEETIATDSRIMIYSAHSKDYINSYFNPNAVTRHLPNVSNPKYISINNAFGRPWQANAPKGIKGSGLISVSDPDGRPLANPPSIENGGVFFGEASNRTYGDYNTNTIIRAMIPGNVGRDIHHQYIGGNLKGASISTAFMGTSPDSSNFAVFAVLGADGNLSQVHVQDGVDGLATSIIQPHKDNSTNAGMVFRWIPNLALFITDFYGDRIALVNLSVDKNVFQPKELSYISSPYIQKPVDIAAAIPEIANPIFSSNTTMAGTSDLYIANQNGSIIRMTEKGEILAKATIDISLIPYNSGKIKSISTSYDAQTLFIGMDGKNNQDFIVSIPAFNASGIYTQQDADEIVLTKTKGLPRKSYPATITEGKRLFEKGFGAADGKAHVFNSNACIDCHNHPRIGGFSADEKNFSRRVSKFNKTSGQFEDILSYNFPVAKRRDLSQAGLSTKQHAGIPKEANIISMRMPQYLLSTTRLDEIPDYVLLSHAHSKGDGIQGRVNYIQTKEGKQIGRYGWKASQPSLQHMIADALSTELGINNPHTIKNEQLQKDPGNGDIVKALTQYLKNL